VDTSTLLLDGVLQNVLSYVGLGHHLFAALVSTRWKKMYATIEHQQLTVRDARGQKRVLTCVPQMTFYSSVLASPSRMKLAVEFGLYCDYPEFWRAAGKHADVATLATAHDLGMQCTETTMICAAECNKLAEVQYLHSEGCPWPSELLERAASDGHFELVRWCYDHGCRWNSDEILYYAAKSGNIKLLAWVLQQPGLELSADTMIAAAVGGHIAMCQYLRTQQCPWSAQTTYIAGRNARVDVLRWLMDNGCPWDKRNLRLAAVTSGSVEMLVLLQQQGLLATAAELTAALLCAGQYNMLAAAKWLREQGAEWPTLYNEQDWHGEAVEWAIAEGFVPPAH
jgi:Ankyrin repeats (many copies)